MTGTQCHDCGILTDARDADEDGRCATCTEINVAPAPKPNSLDGPWKVQELGSRVGYPDWHQYAVRHAKTNVHLATVGNVDRYYERDTKAHAMLMAAAPTMRNFLMRLAAETCDHGPMAFCPQEEARKILKTLVPAP